MADKFTIGPKIAIDGEAEFKKAIKGINTEMTVLGSEMKMVTSQFAKNKDSVEALTAENTVYIKQIDEQKKKIGTIADALESANKEYGENSKEVKNWTIELNNAKAKLYGMEQKVENNEKAIKDQAEAARDGAKAIDAHAKSTSDAEGKTNRWSDALKSTGAVLGKGVTVAAKGAAVAVGVVAGAAAGAAVGLWNTAKSTGAWADELVTTSNQTGIAVEALQGMEYASRFLDVEVETMTGSMAKLVKSMSSAKESGGSVSASFRKIVPNAEDVSIATLKVQAAQEKLNELQSSGKAKASQLTSAQANLLKAQQNLAKVNTGGVIETAGKEATGTAAAFEKLNIKITDSKGNLRSNQDVFYEAIDALGKIGNATERDALSMELFGKSAQDLNPLIISGASALKELQNEAKKAGLILSDDMVAQMGKFDDIMQKTDAQVDGLKKQLVVNFMPALQGVATEMSSVLTDIGGALKDGFQPEDIKTIGQSITTKLVEGIKTFSQYIPDIVSTISGALTEIINVIGTLIPIILPPLLDAAFQLMKGVLDAIIANVEPISKIVTELILKLADFIIENLPMLLDAAIKIVLAVALGIADALPELIPAIVQMIDSIITVIIDNLPVFIEAAIKIIIALGVGLIQALPQLLLQLPKIWLGIRDAFLNIDWGKLGSDIMAGIGKGFTAAVGNLIKSAKEVMGDVVNGIKDFLDINSPSKVMADQIGLNMGLGVAQGLGNASSAIDKTFKDIIPTDLDSQYNVDTSGTATVQHVHKGTLRIEGVNDQGQLMGAVDIVMNQLRMEAMLAGA